VAAVPLISDASSSVRTVPSRRAQFPPLQFVGTGVRTAVKPYNTRSRISTILQSAGAANDMSVACLQPNYDDKVADSDRCSEHVEPEVQAETAEDLPLTKRHRITDAVTAAYRECLSVADSMHSCSRPNELTSCNPVCLKPPCFINIVDDPADRNPMTDGGMLCLNDKDHTPAGKSPHSVVSQQHDLTVCAENTSAVHFDINTPTGEVEPSVCSDDAQTVVMEVETKTCRNASGLGDHNSMEPLRVLCFSHVDRSLDDTEDPMERVICAAELNENMSELLDGDEETSVNARGHSRQSLCHDRPKFFSTPSVLTPLANRHQNTVLVSDTPVSEYGLSYRQRALKAANIRLRHRTQKS